MACDSPWLAADASAFTLQADADTADNVALLDLDAFLFEAPPLSPESGLHVLPPDHGTGPPTAAPTKPFRKRLPPAERALRRRKQHRELVARGRARAKQCVEELRGQELALLTTIDAIVARYAHGQRKPTTSCVRVRPEAEVSVLRNRCIEAVAMSEALCRENDRLEELLDEQVKYQHTIRHAGDVAHAEVQTMTTFELPCESRLLHRRGVWMYFADDDVPFYYEPYTEAECDALMAQTHARALRLHDAFQHNKYPVLAVPCFGWTMQRMLDDTTKRKLRFHWSKRVGCASSAELRQELQAKTWDILHTPHLYAKLHRHKIVERLLQRVDAHTTISVRNNPTAMHALSLRSFTMTRAFTDVDSQGRTRTHILLQALRPQDGLGVALQAKRGIVYISSGFAYVTFVELNENTLEVAYGGKGDVASEQHAACLLAEVGLTWLQWENMVLPQRLLACD